MFASTSKGTLAGALLEELAAWRRSLVDVELLRMKRRIGLNQDRLAYHLLHLLQPARRGALELLDDLRIDAQHHIATIQMLLHLAHLDVDVIADRHRRLHHARARARIARRRQRALERLLHPLARDRNEAEVIELQHLGWRAILLELVFERGHYAIAILALVHVD